MANFFSLQDGNLTDASVYGYSLSGAEVMSNTTGTLLTISDAYGPIFTGDGSTISAIAVNLSSRQAGNTTDCLIVKLSAAGKSVQTEYYPISNFTAYDGRNNLIASYPLNWQILKLSAGYQINNLVSAKISFSTTTNNTISLICSASNNNFNKAVIASTATTPLSTDTLHLGGSIKLSAAEVRTITASTSTYQNIYVHNQGILTFPLTSNNTITLNGSAGLQITSDATLNIGTSSSVIPLSTTHTIVLSNSQIDVHNGGNLNVYGYPKLFSTNLVNDTLSSSRTFTTVDNISSVWNVGDTIAFKPNLVYRTGFDTLALSSFTGSNVFTTTSASIYNHTGVDVYSNIYGIFNLSRNIIIRGLNSTARASIRTIDAARTSVNYAQLSNFGINSINKTGFVFGNNLSGSTTLSGVVINSDNTSTVNNIFPLTGRTFQNSTISDSIIYKSNVITLSGLSTNNVTINNNYILSSGGTGIQMNNLSGSINMFNNTTIGALNYGTLIYNNLLSGSYGSNNFNSTFQGLYLSGINTGTIVGGGVNSVREGVYIDASTYNLSGTIFQNILANNNTSVGFKVSGNSLNYLNPISLYMNGLSANTNSNAGFEGYNISGNLSSLTLNHNISGGIKTSIGNGITTFDGVTSILSSTATLYGINILSAYNYKRTLIQNALVSANLTNSNLSASIGLSIDSGIFGEFSLNNSIISASTPLQLNITRNLLEGSYLFNNSYLGSTPLGTGITSKYQSNVFRNTGFAFTNLNKISAYNITYLVAGSRMLDYVTASITSADVPSERLTPSSSTIKLRSGSKYVAVNNLDSTTISVYIRTSIVSDGTAYNGNPPRLMLKRNPAIGVTSDMVLGKVDSTNNVSGSYVLLNATTPVATDDGVFEFYVDCDGTAGWINIDNWDAV